MNSVTGQIIFIALIVLSLIVVYSRLSDKSFVRIWIIYAVSAALIFTTFIYASAYGLGMREFRFVFWEGSVNFYIVTIKGNMLDKQSVEFWLIGGLLTFVLFGIPLATVYALGVYPRYKYDQYIRWALRHKLSLFPQLYLILLFLSSVIAPDHYPIQSWLLMLISLFAGLNFFSLSAMVSIGDFFDVDIMEENDSESQEGKSSS